MNKERYIREYLKKSKGDIAESSGASLSNLFQNRIPETRTVILREPSDEVREVISHQINKFKHELSEEIKTKEVKLQEAVDSSESKQTGYSLDIINKIKEVLSFFKELRKTVFGLENRLNQTALKKDLPKPIVIEEDGGVEIRKEEKKEKTVYKIRGVSKTSTTVINSPGGGGSSTGAVSKIVAGTNISISPSGGTGEVTISSTASGVSTAGSTFYAGQGILITGSTISNTLPGVSLQAGNNISIQGVTISAINMGISLTDNLPEGVSNFYYRPTYIFGNGGASVTVVGKTVSIYSPLGTTLFAGDGIAIQGQTISNTILGISALNDVLYTGLSDTDLLTYNGSKWVNTNKDNYISSQANVDSAYQHSQISGQNPHQASIEQIVGVSINTPSQGHFLRYTSNGDWSNEAITTDNITEGSSSFYYRPNYFVGTGGVSVSSSGMTVTIYGLSKALDQATLGLTRFGEKSYNSLTDQPDLSVYAKGTSLFGLYILGSSFHNAVTVVDSTTVDLGVSNNQSLTASVIQTGLGLSALGEKSYNSLENKIGFVGAGGVSLSLVGSTYTIFGLSSSVNTDQVSEGVSNFYYRADRLASDTGVSIYKSGVTAKIGVVQADINTNNVTEGNSGLFYSSARFSSSFDTKSTNDLSEGTSNFYYKPNRFIGTGGVSVSYTGITLTIYGNSTALNTNNAQEGSSGLFYSVQRFNSDFALKNTNDLLEGTSNFYWRVDRVNAGSGVSITRSGVTVTIQASASVAAGGVSGQFQYNDGGAIVGLSDFSYFYSSSDNFGQFVVGREDPLHVTKFGFLPSNSVFFGIAEDATTEVNSDGMNMTFEAGNGGASIGSGGVINIFAGDAVTDGNGGDILFGSGDAVGSSRISGNVIISVGNNTGNAQRGYVKVINRPSSVTPSPGDMKFDNQSGRYLFGSTNFNFSGTLDFSLVSGDRSYSFPDKGGTVALLSDTISDGNKGDITVSGSGSTMSINEGKVDIINYVTTAQSGTSAGYVGISNLMFSMLPNCRYFVDGFVIYKSGASTMGVLFGVNAPSGASLFIYSQKTITNTGAASTDQLSTSFLTANDTPLPNSTAEPSVTVPLLWKTNGVVINAGTSGLFQLRVSKENVAGTYTVLPGSYLKYRRIL